MTGPALSALLVSFALLALPGAPRNRVEGLAASRGAGQRRAAAVAAVAAAGAAVSMPPALLPVGVIAGTVLAVWRRRRASGRRRSEEGRAMAAALEVLVGELRAGSHPGRAFAIAAAESSGTVGTSLQRVAARSRLGADVAAGLLVAEHDSAIPAYWRRLAIFWDLAAQRGLALTALMQAAHTDIVERRRFSERIHADLAGARATAVILAALPVLGAILGELIGAHPVRFLLDGGLGGVLLVSGTGLIAAGLAWADRIIERLMT